MYTLYYAQGACSKPIHILLKEIGENFEIQRINLQKGEQKSPDFLKINPRGQIPALKEDGKTLVEGAAILTYLADKHQSSYMPQDGWQRAEALRWLMFANATLHTAYSKALWLTRNMEESPEKNKIMNVAMDNIQDLWNQIETHLNETCQPFLAGSQITLGDLVTAVIARWTFIPRAMTFGSATQKLIDAVEQLPSFREATAAEEEQAKAA